jgi:hypothetical protein
LGRKFIVCIDHFSLKYLLDQRLSTIPQHQWASKLLDFNFKVEFKPVGMNIVADTLSRRDTVDTNEILALSTPTFSLFNDLCAELSLFNDLCAELDADQKLRTLQDDMATGIHG